MPMEPITVASPRTAPRSADLFRASRKRFQSHLSLHGPVLVLNGEGSLLHLSDAARTLLEYRPDQSIEPCFFAHVHGRNHYQVMRDVADMVCYGRQFTTWLLRLRTGQGRWRWYKAHVQNDLGGEVDAILIRLSDLYDW